VAKYAVVDFRMRKVEKEYIESLGYEIIENGFNLDVYDEISSHVDIYYLKAGDEFYIDKMYFKVLWPSSNQLDVNNNSLVIYSVLFNTRFLFTGDIEKEAEYKLIKEIGKIEVDVLKVAHHGSKTSSTEIFLNSVKFKYAISMNGYKNTFGFPHSSVVERINSIENVYMFNTLECGTITFYRNNKRNDFKISMSYK
jgi:competence protein ComEC